MTDDRARVEAEEMYALLCKSTGPSQDIAIITDALLAYGAAQRAEEREACAKEIPTNWIDSLLTGPKKALSGEPGTWGCPDVERLLNGIATRIRARREGPEAA